MKPQYIEYTCPECEFTMNHDNYTGTPTCGICDNDAQMKKSRDGVIITLAEKKANSFRTCHNPDYPGMALCNCGDPYERHFHTDGGQSDQHCNCKYCDCDEFDPDIHCEIASAYAAKIQEELDSLTKDEPKKFEWISVEDNLPKKSGSYYVVYNGGVPTIYPKPEDRRQAVVWFSATVEIWDSHNEDIRYWSEKLEFPN